jgi:hypothetical protein
MDDFPTGIPQRRLWDLLLSRGSELDLQFSILFAVKKDLPLFLSARRKKKVIYFG